MSLPTFPSLFFLFSPSLARARVSGKTFALFSFNEFFRRLSFHRPLPSPASCLTLRSVCILHGYSQKFPSRRRGAGEDGYFYFGFFNFLFQSLALPRSLPPFLSPQLQTIFRCLNSLLKFLVTSPSPSSTSLRKQRLLQTI